MERSITHSTNRDGLLLRSESRSAATTSSDFVLQWGNRKRLRCMKFQAKEHGNGVNNSSASGLLQRATTRVDRRVVRSDLNKKEDPNSNQPNSSRVGKSNGGGNGYLNLRQRPASPSHRILRNSECSLGMRGQSNGVRGLASPGEGGTTGNNNNNNNSTNRHSNKNGNNSSGHHNDNHYQHGGGGGSGSSGNTRDEKKGGSCSYSGGDTIAPVWPPKFVIGLTTKEKEEDFMAIKGSKLPQRPKKRAKFVQRTLNLQLVSPGAWLCELTLERYEVREKKVSKKRHRGLKAMGNMVESDSE